MNANGHAFGSYGVVGTMVACMVIMTTMSMVCAVFSPVWINRRQTERGRQHRQP